MFIDCHTHAFADKIAEKAVEQLINYYHMPTTHNGRFEELLRLGAAAGMDALILLVAATKPEQVKPANDYALALNRLKFPDIQQQFGLNQPPRIFPFGTYHPGDPYWLDEIRRLRAAGIKGLKLHPEFQSIDLGNPQLFDFWAEIENDFIVLVHVGDPRVDPNNYSTPKKVARILANFPRLRLIAAHLGGLYFWDEVCTELAGKDVYFDTSSSLQFIHPSLLRKIFDHHSKERILFGSDYPLCSPQDARKQLEKLNWLSTRDKELIYGENCAKLLGLQK